MANLDGFDAREVDPQAGFDPIPAGKYLAVINSSEMKETKNKDGNYLELVFQIIEGQYKNRLLWDRLNLDNQNPTAVQIARSQLSAICRAVGVMTPRDSCELHNLPLVVTVKLKKREDTGELQNDISGYAKKDAAPAPAPQVPGQTPPWRRS